MTYEQYLQIVSDISHVPVDQINENDSFRDQLCIDSLKMVNLIMEISQTFGLRLESINSFEEIRTVRALYNTFIR
jgi:acyl carrier protein